MFLLIDNNAITFTCNKIISKVEKFIYILSWETMKVSGFYLEIHFCLVNHNNLHVRLQIIFETHGVL